MRKLVFLNVLQIVPNRLFINFSLYYKKKSFCSNETMRKSDILMRLSERNKCIVDDASMIKGGV